MSDKPICKTLSLDCGQKYSNRVRNKTNPASKSSQESSASTTPLLKVRTILAPDSRTECGESVACSSSAASLADPLKNESKTMKRMLQPVPIFCSNSITISHSWEYLSDVNRNFYVVGVIGPQNSGKSTVMNLIAAMDNSRHEEPTLTSMKPTFKMRDHTTFSNPSAISDSVQMYITEGRLILLDSPALCCNKFKKKHISQELDDLKTISFMLSVCHLVIVVLDNYFNTNIIRDLQRAEMMTRTNEKRYLNENLAKIMFVKNKAKDDEFYPSPAVSLEKYYGFMFKDSQLSIYQNAEADLINYFTIPMMQTEGSSYNCTNEFIDTKTVISNFRKRLFMSSDYKFKKECVMTEKQWSKLAISVWDSQRSNYFFRKYEELFMKENPKDRRLLPQPINSWTTFNSKTSNSGFSSEED